MQQFGEVTSLHTPEFDFAPCPADFIESVAIDPRCPPHKSDFMRRWFEQRGIRVVQSKCFGYLADDLDLFSEE